jgi:DNA-3-methyladenine glycosylase II
MPTRKNRIITPPYWDDAKAHLMRVCPLMARLIPQYADGALQPRVGSGFNTLARAIVGQQISVKAADAVWGRLVQKLSPFTPQRAMRMHDKTLRGCGLSASKVAYLKNIAAFFIEHPYATPDDWARYDDEQAILLLSQIKGVGRWTAEMFLLFYLQRPDILPLQDLGLLKAMHLYLPDIPEQNGKKFHKPALYEGAANLWKPYRSAATWYLWRALDPVPVVY